MDMQLDESLVQLLEIIGKSPADGHVPFAQVPMHVALRVCIHVEHGDQSVS